MAVAVVEEAAAVAVVEVVGEAEAEVAVAAVAEEAAVVAVVEVAVAEAAVVEVAALTITIQGDPARTNSYRCKGLGRRHLSPQSEV